MNTILSPLAKNFIEEFGRKEATASSSDLSVSALVSDVARWYEKLRNALEYHEEEIIIRSAIERILKRRLLFEKQGKIIAKPLVQELLWARYFQENTISEELVGQVATKIDLYQGLYTSVQKQKKISHDDLSDWFIEVLSAELANLLHADRSQELVAHFMYYIMRDKIVITSGSEQEQDVQTFIAIRRCLLKEDRAMLRYALFTQYFGELTHDTIAEITKGFVAGYKQTEKNLAHPLQRRIVGYVKKQTPPFLVLREVLFNHRDNLQQFLADPKNLDEEILATCTAHYKTIADKVRRALVRSIIFLFCTKVIIAMVVEGSYERLVYGQIAYVPMFVTVLSPPLLIVFGACFIKPPGEKNSQRIRDTIHSILTDPAVSQIKIAHFKSQEKNQGLKYTVFLALWFTSALTTIGIIVSLLTQLGMHAVSQVLFVFFMATASFLAYRINQSSTTYKAYEERQRIWGALFDFMFMPIIYLGRRFAEGVTKFNVFLIIFDYVIEMPLKSIFALSEEWLLFLRQQKEKLD